MENKEDFIYILENGGVYQVIHKDIKQVCFILDMIVIFLLMLLESGVGSNYRNSIYATHATHQSSSEVSQVWEDGITLYVENTWKIS